MRKYYKTLQYTINVKLSQNTVRVKFLSHENEQFNYTPQPNLCVSTQLPFTVLLKQFVIPSKLKSCVQYHVKMGTVP